MTTDKTAQIAELNDLFRSRVNPGLGKVLFTSGISRLNVLDQMLVMHRVANFSDFTPDNDPHGERDFGAFDHAGEKIFWKIDYYDRTITTGSEDPSDPFVTTRVLTIMLASEY